jgi:hypothetical protein
MLFLKTNYTNNITPAWVFRESICKEVKYENYNSNRGHFAYFKLKFEYYESEKPIVFEDKAMLQEEHIGSERLENAFEVFKNRIVTTLEESFNDIYIKGYPIINLKIILSNLLIDTRNSIESSYLLATEYLLMELFKSDNILLRVDKK